MKIPNQERINKALTTDKGSNLILHSIRQERRATQKNLVFRSCKKDALGIQSYVFAKGTLRRINLLINLKYNFSFVKTVLLRTLYWKSLIFRSNDTLNESEYVSF